LKNKELWLPSAPARPSWYDAARVRILIDYRPALRERTGVGQYVHELTSALQPQLGPGESLTLFSSSWKDRLDSAVVPGAARVDRRIPVRVLNLAWHRLEWPPIESLAGRVDVAHSAHPLLMPARKALRVVTVYDLDFLDHPERTRAEIRRDYRSLASAHVRRADLVIVISDYTAGLVRTRLEVEGGRLAVCRPGAPRTPQRDRPLQVGPILFVGTIEPRKNLPLLFAAYERIVARRPDVPALVLAGRTVEQSAGILQDLARRAGLAGRVRYLGYIGDDERERLYREASMLVLPSLEEGFGMTAVEAMQIGVPVIASRRGALPEVVGDAGTLIDPTREIDLARAIEDLLADPDKRLRHAEAGVARARMFSWTRSAAVLLEAYRETMARARAGRGR
jgi:glycosyltransferase involved in cell wall biosynthesis